MKKVWVKIEKINGDEGQETGHFEKMHFNLYFSINNKIDEFHKIGESAYMVKWANLYGKKMKL